MSRLAVAVLLIAALSFVFADECSDGCPCGQECNNGACEEGCSVAGTFIASGSEADIGGVKCKCDAEVDERGHVLRCSDASLGSQWTKNPKC